MMVADFMPVSSVTLTKAYEFNRPDKNEVGGIISRVTDESEKKLNSPVTNTFPVVIIMTLYLILNIQKKVRTKYLLRKVKSPMEYKVKLKKW